MKQIPAAPTSSLAKRLLGLVLTAHILFPFAWILSQITADQLDQRDWYYIRLAGRRLLERDWSSIYSSVDSGFLWRYPPFALYLAALLALLDSRTAYWLIVLVAITALAAALYLLRDALQPNDFGLAALAVATSAAFTSVLVTGQNSALIALTITAGLWLLLRGDETLPFVLFGLLAVKPNWLPFFALYALLRRRLRGLGIVVAVGATVAVAALPLGIDLSRAFIDASLHNSERLTSFPRYKLITMRSFLGALAKDPTLAWSLWAVVLVVLVGCAIYVWLPKSKAPVPRQIAVIVLVTITANLYVAFYDGLVIMIPALVWWALRDTYSSKMAWRAIGAIVTFIWIWDQAVFYYAGVARSLGVLSFQEPSLSLVGPALAAWVIIEALDIRSLKSRRQGDRLANTEGATP